MMGCFTACFRASKHRKSRKIANPALSSKQRLGRYEAVQLTKKEKTEIAIKPISDRKIYVEFSTQAPENCSAENGQEPKRDEGNDGLKAFQEFTKDSAENGKEKERDGELKEELSTQEITNGSVESQGGKQREKGGKEKTSNESQTLMNSGIPSPKSCLPKKHRYNNCTDKDVEGDKLGSEERNFGVVSDNNEVQGLIQEDSSESLFSLSIESRRANRIEDDDKEVNSPIPIRGCADKRMKQIGLNLKARYQRQNVDPVMTTKAKAGQLLKEDDKENMDLDQELNVPFSEEPSIKNLKPKSRQQKSQVQEIGVDTSLSSWLVESEKSGKKTPTATNSPSSIGNSSLDNFWRSFEDRPILGALTVDDLRQLSKSPSPRRSPRHSPDEMSIIGTVGSYWSHTGQTMDSYSSSSDKDKPRNCKEVDSQW